MAAIDVRVAVLAGGSGTRFWPVGRRSWPKQVLALDGDDPRPLLDLTLERLRGVGSHAPWVVAGAALAPQLLRLTHAREEDLVLEPRPRNTAAAVVLAAHVARREAPGAVLVVVPADQHVRPAGRYRRALAAMAARAAKADTILTLGLEPDRPATGYGYLRLGPRRAQRAVGAIHQVECYVEKPSAARARRLATDGRHLFNGGTFAFRPEVLLAEAAAHLPEVAIPIAEAQALDAEADRRAALARAYDVIPSISVDYGIMERTKRVEVLASDLTWDDLGSWDAVARTRRPDASGNAVRGSATLVDTRDCVVDAGEGHVALLGVKDLLVVRTGDTVLVARRGRGEDVRKVVERLEAEGREDLLT